MPTDIHILRQHRPLCGIKAGRGLPWRRAAHATCATCLQHYRAEGVSGTRRRLRSLAERNAERRRLLIAHAAER